MPFASVVKPVAGPEAFSRSDDAAVLSQAAFLLALGAQLSDDEPARMVRAAAAEVKVLDVLPSEDLSVFPIPSLKGPSPVVRSDIQLRSLEARYGHWVAEKELSGYAEKALPSALVDLAERVYREPIPSHAADLMQLSRRSPSPLVRVVAAAALLPAADDPGIQRTLEAGVRESDPLVRELAALALSRLAEDHPLIRSLTEKGRGAGAAAGANTTMLVHGTFALNNDWWQPDGDFHTYIRQQVRPDLYSLPDRFDWSGGYSDPARQLGAQQLFDWVTQRNEAGLNLFCHSHGGNVAMLATRMGLQIGDLVLLSCPANESKYVPEFNRIRRAISIRVHLDLIILGDWLVGGGAQRFRHPQIEENVLPLWFDHSATHNPGVWTTHNVPSLIS